MIQLIFCNTLNFFIIEKCKLIFKNKSLHQILRFFQLFQSAIKALYKTKNIFSFEFILKNFIKKLYKKFDVRRRRKSLKLGSTDPIFDPCLPFIYFLSVCLFMSIDYKCESVNVCMYVSLSVLAEASHESQGKL